MRPRKDRETHFRGKRVVLSERDELAYSRVLREFDPEIRGIDRVFRGNRELQTGSDGLSYDDSRTVCLHVFPPEAKKRLPLYREFGLNELDLRIPLDFRRSIWSRPIRDHHWAFEEILNWGEVWVAFPMGDDELGRFAMKVLRLAGKVTWKRGPFGLDACRWSQTGGSVRRGLGNGQLIDPAEKIELNKYYDDSLWDDGLSCGASVSRDRDPA